MQSVQTSRYLLGQVSKWYFTCDFPTHLQHQLSSLSRFSGPIYSVTKTTKSINSAAWSVFPVNCGRVGLEWQSCPASPGHAPLVDRGSRTSSVGFTLSVDEDIWQLCERRGRVLELRCSWKRTATPDTGIQVWILSRTICWQDLEYIPSACRRKSNVAGYSSTTF